MCGLSSVLSRGVFLVLSLTLTSCLAQDTGGDYYSSWQSAMIAAIILGILLFLALILLIVFCVLWRKEKKRANNYSPDIPSPSKQSTTGHSNPAFNKDVEAGVSSAPRQQNNNKSHAGYVQCKEFVSPTKEDVQQVNGSARKVRQDLSARFQRMPLLMKAASHGSHGSLDNGLPSQGGEILEVPLESNDIIGLGFNIQGSISDGIFVSQVHNRGPAKESGLINIGDRILAVNVDFTNMVHEDALTILSYASPYPVNLVLQRPPANTQHAASPLVSGHRGNGDATESGADANINHPVYRSQSYDDVSKIHMDDKWNSPKRTWSEMKRAHPMKQASLDEAGSLKKWSNTQNMMAADSGDLVVKADVSRGIDLDDLDDVPSAQLDKARLKLNSDSINADNMFDALREGKIEVNDTVTVEREVAVESLAVQSQRVVKEMDDVKINLTNDVNTKGGDFMDGLDNKKDFAMGELSRGKDKAWNEVEGLEGNLDTKMEVKKQQVEEAWSSIEGVKGNLDTNIDDAELKSLEAETEKLTVGFTSAESKLDTEVGDLKVGINAKKDAVLDSVTSSKDDVSGRLSSIEAGVSTGKGKAMSMLDGLSAEDRQDMINLSYEKPEDNSSLAVTATDAAQADFDVAVVDAKDVNVEIVNAQPLEAELAKDALQFEMKKSTISYTKAEKYLSDGIESDNSDADMVIIHTPPNGSPPSPPTDINKNQIDTKMDLGGSRAVDMDGLEKQIEEEMNKRNLVQSDLGRIETDVSMVVNVGGTGDVSDTENGQDVSEDEEEEKNMVRAVLKDYFGDQPNYLKQFGFDKGEGDEGPTMEEEEDSASLPSSPEENLKNQSPLINRKSGGGLSFDIDADALSKIHTEPEKPKERVRSRPQHSGGMAYFVSIDDQNKASPATPYYYEPPLTKDEDLLPATKNSAITTTTTSVEVVKNAERSETPDLFESETRYDITALRMDALSMSVPKHKVKAGNGGVNGDFEDEDTLVISSFEKSQSESVGGSDSNVTTTTTTTSVRKESENMPGMLTVSLSDGVSADADGSGGLDDSQA